MPTCPNGHQSGSEDWCEVCGHRMTTGGAPAGAVPPPPPPPPAPGYGYPQPGSGTGGGQPTMQAELCPQCRTPREAMAPYCEECRWNFLTNTATSYTPLAPQHGTPSGPPPGLNLPPGFQAPGPGGQGGPGGPGGQHGPGGHGGPGGQGGQPGAPQPRDPFDYQGSRPSQMNRPAEPLAPEQNGPHGNGGQGGPPPQSFQQGPPPPPSFQQQGPPQQSAPSTRSPFEPQQPAPSGHSPFEPQQASPFAPPQHQQQSAPPAPPQSSGHTGGGDDWMLSPPSQAQPSQPPQQFQQPDPYQGQGPGQGQGHQGQGQPGPGRQQGQDQGYDQGYDQGQQHGGVPGQGRSQESVSWTAVIAPDRAYFLAMMQRSGPEATGLNLPAYSPEQRLPLTGGQITIGRRRQSTGESPDVDLSVPPEDPGVSHQHAVLVQQPDGGWAVVDQNSTNGTTLNGAEEPIQPYVPVPLQDGDQVHVGAWTTITVRRD
ncbi:FHA domain-containing protein [Streptomyces durocortorensis]|uniref:FHA domain-containing protein n=1 Tax=Streptomyces durocortorensis TaxID=2811104 RepID=A0ABS2HQS1_9ACTN|nr:FHA domain-containing protein [Streptomyces durocortorensis]MBM7053035.1 FHA domain-containing protein [Streptomyces durocortorensis]